MSLPPPEEELDLESRELCPNGACVGVLAQDGRCHVCGLAREEADPGSAAVSANSFDPPSADHSAAADSAEFDARQLCPDGACTGLLGPTGRCKVCGASPTA